MRSSYHSSNLPAERQPDVRYARNHDARQEQVRAYDSGAGKAVHHEKGNRPQGDGLHVTDPNETRDSPFNSRFPVKRLVGSWPVIPFRSLASQALRRAAEGRRWRSRGPRPSVRQGARRQAR
jgi:hypothetical protein